MKEEGHILKPISVERELARNLKEIE